MTALEWTIATCRLLAAVAGVLFMWAGLFLKVDEAGEVQRTFERWANGLSGWPDRVGSRRLLILRVAATVSSRVFDRVLGTPLWSIRSLSVIGCVSAGLGITAWALLGFGGCSALSLGSALVAAGLTSILRRDWPLLAPTVLGMVVIGAMTYALSRFYSRMEVGLYGFAAITGVLSSVVVVALTRRLLQWAARAGSFTAAATVVGTNGCAVILLAYWSPTLLMLVTIANLERFNDANRFGLLLFLAPASVAVTASSLPAIVASLLVVVVAAAVVMDQCFWFMFERVVYAAARHKIIDQSRGLIILGATLLVVGAPEIGKSMINGVRNIMP